MDKIYVEYHLEITNLRKEIDEIKNGLMNLEKEGKNSAKNTKKEFLSLGDELKKIGKELSIGSKRNKLYKSAKGLYSTMLDDDDFVPEYYIAEVMEALKQDPDCIGYLEQCTMNGEVKIACHSNRFKDWKTNYAGYDYVRTIFYKDVIKTAIAKKVGVHDMRFGEDHNFAKRLKISRLLQKEVFIDKIMYLYEHNSMTPKEYKLRYGIK